MRFPRERYPKFTFLKVMRSEDPNRGAKGYGKRKKMFNQLYNYKK